MDSKLADSKLVEELRLLLDAAAERAQPWLHRMATEDEHDTRTCGWCPVCNAVALARGDRSELAAKAAEHVAGLIAVLRAALAEPSSAADGAFGDVGDVGEERARPEKPRVQHIPVVRRGQGSQC
ncbi:hypothetical protein ALI22I_22630 [Saccharothrix sp. ALI-22-I]|uniref:hypothetical protein n=1 Tax=Saccharothrix sp. ALI-22-I TaxID=1933778 RepID=UPI00097BE002|nr:hypothetical protein [Saccharothrix sp. ALI-22-I]ONI87242.1 hypothetical protein ALI22I_22630 [Saccharothrix sp. ALI-22-I]